jgi:Tfp pilus assembly protein PilZ
LYFLLFRRFICFTRCGQHPAAVFPNSNRHFSTKAVTAAVAAVTSESAQEQTADAAQPGASDPVVTNQTQKGAGLLNMFRTQASAPVPTPTQVQPLTQTPSDEGFKQLSKQYGSNQVVYRPQLNIASLSAHLAYMGVSYMGVLRHAGIFLKRYEDEFAIGNGVMYLKDDPKKALNRINRKPSNTKLAIYNLRSTIRNLAPEPVELLKGINSQNAVQEDPLARNRKTRKRR